MRNFTIFLIDDDQDVLQFLTTFVRTHGYKSRAYSLARHFLDEHDPSVPGCVLLDLSMPAMNGLDVQRELVKRGIERPIIFLTGFGTVSASVEAMKAGAVDFLPKPVKDDELLNAIKIAEKRETIRLQRDAERSAITEVIGQLTPRQREVMQLVVQGHMNKDIAPLIETTEKTVKVHRGRMMQKMGVRSVAELVRMVNKVLSET